MPGVWLVDVQDDPVHVHREPTPDGHRLVQTLRRGDRIAPLAFPDRDLDTAELLG
jgi:Uma2 family endonuclease